MFVILRLWGVQCVWGNATTKYLPQPPRGLFCQPVSEWEVTRWAETILVTDNSHFEGPKLLVIRWEGLMWWTIYWALWICWFCGVWGRTVAPGEDFVGMTLRSACKWRVKKPSFRKFIRKNSSRRSCSKWPQIVPKMHTTHKYTVNWRYVKFISTTIAVF